MMLHVRAVSMRVPTFHRGPALFVLQVPFEDAARVCDLSGDTGAMPALLEAYVFGKPRPVPVSSLEYYCDCLSVLPALIQLQVRKGPRAILGVTTLG